jgi:hypothetical protein
MIETISENNTKKSRVKRITELTAESREQQLRWSSFWESAIDTPSRRQYNLTIGANPRFVWFRNAKVGTRSIFAALDAAGVQYTADSPMRSYYNVDDYVDFFKFAFVRNPFDRLVSCWQNKIKKRNAFDLPPEVREDLFSFSRFLDYVSAHDLTNCNTHFRLQSCLIDLNEVDFIGRMEHFEQDIKTVFQLLDLPMSEIPHNNKSKPLEKTESVTTRENFQRCYDLYRKDFQLFGYEPRSGQW